MEVSRHEKDHRSGPKTRTGPDSGPSPRPKKISQNPRTCNGLGPIRVRSKSDSDLGYSLIQAGKSLKCYRVRSNHIKVRMTNFRSGPTGPSRTTDRTRNGLVRSESVVRVK